MVQLPSMEISMEEKLLPWKLVEASMEFDFLPREWADVYTEVDGKFHGSRRTIRRVEYHLVSGGDAI